MGTIVKWGVLAAGIATVVALIMDLPFVSFIDLYSLGDTLVNIAMYIGTGLQAARGFINFFLPDFAIDILSGIMIYLFSKWLITLSIKFVVWIYHFVFAG